MQYLASTCTAGERIQTISNIGCGLFPSSKGKALVEMPSSLVDILAILEELPQPINVLPRLANWETGMWRRGGGGGGRGTPFNQENQGPRTAKLDFYITFNFTRSLYCPIILHVFQGGGPLICQQSNFRRLSPGPRQEPHQTRCTACLGRQARRIKRAQAPCFRTLIPLTFPKP